MTTVNEAVLDRLASGLSEFHSKKPFSPNADPDSIDEAIDQLHSVEEWAEQEHGMRDIGEGDDRVTFTAGSAAPSDCVVKVSKSGGTAQNMEEVEVWKRMDSDARSCVAPLVTWSNDYTWVVQKRASQASSPSASADVLDRLNEAGWTCNDVKPDNVGVLDGTPVLIDLGVGLRLV